LTINISYIPPTGHKIYFRDLFLNQKRPDIQALWFNSGTAALYFLLKQLNIPPQSKILIPAYTCPSVATAVLKAGYLPILSDLNPLSLSYKTDILKENIKTNNARAVIWVNLFGINSGIPYLDVPVILDNAQSIPFKIPDNVNAVIFSFGRGKPISAMGGGVAIVNDRRIFKEFQREQITPASVKDLYKYLFNIIAFKIFFHPVLYRIPQTIPWLHLGETIFHENFPFSRILPLNLKIIANLLHRKQEILENRRQICSRYRIIFKGMDDQVVLYPGNEFYRFPVLIKKEGIRNQILMELKGRGIGVSELYPYPLHKQPGLAEILKDGKDYPGAEFISRNLITLPVNEFITENILSEIKQIFGKYLKNS